MTTVLDLAATGGGDPPRRTGRATRLGLWLKNTKMLCRAILSERQDEVKADPG